MSETLEHELKAAFAQSLAGISPNTAIRVAETDYHPRRHRRSLVPLTSGATAFAASVVAVVLLLSSGTPSAFAGWTALPARATAPDLRQAEAACDTAPATNVVASEARGPFVAIVYTLNSSPWECVTRGKSVLINQTTPDPPSAFASPGNGRVTLPDLTIRRAYGASLKMQDALLRLDGALNAEQGRPGSDKQRIARSRRKLRRETYAIVTGPDSLTAVTGAVGDGVTGVTLVLADGQRVLATVKNDWYTAWWPGVSTHNAFPVSIEVTTATGTSPADFSRKSLSDLFGPCLEISGCSTAQTITLRPISAARLNSHFKLFTTVLPASQQAIRKLRVGDIQGVTRNDLAKARAVSFGSLGTLVAIPLSNGACLVIEPRGTNVCNGNVHNVINGMIENIFVQDPPRSETLSHEVVGLVPNGNRTVIVRLKSGKTVRLRVKHNLVFGQFKTAPAVVSYGHPSRTLRYSAR